MRIRNPSAHRKRRNRVLFRCKKLIMFFIFQLKEASFDLRVYSTVDWSLTRRSRYQMMPNQGCWIALLDLFSPVTKFAILWRWRTRITQKTCWLYCKSSTKIALWRAGSRKSLFGTRRFSSLQVQKFADGQSWDTSKRRKLLVSCSSKVSAISNHSGL